MSVFLLLTIALICLIFQAFFAGYETGAVSVSHISIASGVKEGSRHARRAEGLLQRPDRVVATTLFWTNISIVILTTVMVHVFDRFQWAASVTEIVTTVAVAPVVLVFGEIIPKSLFRTHANRLVPIFSHPVSFFYKLAYPCVVALTTFAALLARFVGVPEKDRKSLVTREELLFMLGEGEEGGVIDESEREMISGVIDLGTTMAHEVMVPRTDMVAIEINQSREELLNLFQSSRHSRIPVYRESIDNIEGVIHVLSLIGATSGGEDNRIAQYMTPAVFVPDTKNVGELLHELRTSKSHMAIVIDEYGGTDGFVTIENLLEEIFGEIQDEYDKEKPPFKKIGEDTFIIDARMSIAEANESLDLNIPEDVAETVGGFVLDISGKIPGKGEQYDYDNLQITVIDADDHSLSRIKIKIDPRPESRDDAHHT
ncbi:hemolysin family protein [Candidatus Hydrogenedentota bacterium]